MQKSNLNLDALNSDFCSYFSIVFLFPVKIHLTKYLIGHFSNSFF